MAVLSKKQTDEFCNILLKRKGIYWEDLAQELCSQSQYEDLRRIVKKRSNPKSKFTEAEKYFIETLSRTVAQIKNGLANIMVNEPGGAQKMLELIDPKYSSKYKDSVRLQAHIVLNTLDTICNDPKNIKLTPPEIFETFLRELATADSSGATIEAWEALCDSLST